MDFTLKGDAKKWKSLLIYKSMLNERYNIKNIPGYWILQTLCCFLLKVEEKFQAPS